MLLKQRVFLPPLKINAQGVAPIVEFVTAALGGGADVQRVVVNVGVAYVAADENRAVVVFAPVVLADVIADGVVAAGIGRVRVGINEIARAVIVVGIVVLQNGIGDAAIQIEAAAVKGLVTGSVVVRLAMLNHNVVAGRRPDSDRPARFARTQCPVIMRDAVVNHAAIHKFQKDTAAGMVLGEVRIAGIVVGEAVVNGHIRVGVARGVDIEHAGHVNARISVVMRGTMKQTNIAVPALAFVGRGPLH